MKVSKEFKVGLLVILGLLLLFVGVNFLKGGSIFGKSREFYAVYTNSAGLATSNEVKLSGFKIGQVEEVGLHPDNPTLILVKFSITDDELQIPNTSEAWLVTDLLGTASIDMRLDTMRYTNIDYYQDGDTIIARSEMSIQDQVNEQILPLKKRTEELIGSVESIIVSVNAFWDTSAAYTIDESLYEVRDAIGTFAELAQNLSVLISNETEMIDKILVDVHAITGTLSEKSDQISSTIDNITAISDTLADSDIKSVILETKGTLVELNGVLAKVNDGEGTLGALMHDSTLYYELRNTNIHVQNLLQDMEDNPQKYVHFSIFGRKTNGYTTTSEREVILDNLLDSLQTK
ncbi:MAG: MlaD family protein [Crocinitomicaceae bacterium]|nr:MlaD family protein [Crocinitomicaceae bacterium]